MRKHLKKGLDLPIVGQPVFKQPRAVRSVSHVGVLGRDAPGLKLRPAVKEGDAVLCGDPLLFDKDRPEIKLTAPGSGVVKAVTRGDRRVLLSVSVILSKEESFKSFASYAPEKIADLSAEKIKDQLCESGLWVRFRERPFNLVPDPNIQPAALFITATDTNPLALDPAYVLNENRETFARGCVLLSRLLPDVPIHLCASPDVGLDEETLPESFEIHTFSGKHPAGNAGTHMHFIHSPRRETPVWQIGWQDILHIAELFTDGRLPTERYVAVGGDGILVPGLTRLRVGADVRETIHPLIKGMGNGWRVISGSVFSGGAVTPEEPFLSARDDQISVINAEEERPFMGWLLPRLKRFGMTRLWWLQKLTAPFPFSALAHGSPRALVPIGLYEKVMPLDLLATPLARSLLVADTERAEELGALELAPEDVALMSFVCPAKINYSRLLEETLTRLEKES